MELFFNLDLLSLGVAVAAIGILSLIVFSSNSRSATNRAFLLFSIATIIYSVVNYFANQPLKPEIALWLLRVAVFFAVWHAFSFFYFFYTFPKEDNNINKHWRYILVSAVSIVSILTLTPLVFSSIASLSDEGRIRQIVNGPAIPIFGLSVIALMISGLVLQIKKTFLAKGEERIQFIYVLLGSLITFPSYIIFGFILPVVFENPRFVPLAGVFIFPFVAFTFFAIIKHHLLNVKVISTEILTFILAIVTLVEVVLSHDVVVLIFRSSVFVLVLIFGILLIKSVLREVEQREKLEKVTKELELANVELKRLDESKSEFISIASHQLRTPLTIIKGFISMINEGSFGRVPPKIREQLVKVFASNERLISLVEDLLNLSRIESGRQEYKWQETDLTALVGSVSESLTKNAEAKGLKLKFIAPKAKVPSVVCDSDKLHEVLMNFVDNAIKYTPAGSVTVSLEAKPAGMVTVAVKDTGMGIAPQNLGYLFQKFSRVKGSFLVQPGGSGLGLYVAKKIVDVHEGKIWAESPGEGKGTTFAFSLPIAGPKVRPQAKAKLPTPLGQVPAGAGPVTPPAPSAVSGIVK